jgi:serine/threonine protein kinase
MDESVAVPGYVLAEELGHGGMGVVYAATEVATGRKVAIKLMRVPEDGARRLAREARAAQALRHPGLVEVYDHGAYGDQQYLVMELIDGEDLQHRLDRAGSLDPAVAVAVVADVADAVAALHQAGFVHRDIKPANVLFSPEGQTKLTDYGLAYRPVPDVGLSSDSLWARTAGSQTRDTGGTYAYMAPEQWTGDPVDARSDVYALGALLLATLTARAPHAGATLPERAYHGTVADHPALTRNPAPLPPALKAITDRAMSRDPADRYPSALAFRAALLTAAAKAGTHRPNRGDLAAALAVTIALTTAIATGIHAPAITIPQIRTVCAHDVTLRAKPASSDVLATLHHGQRVQVTGSARDGKWIEVRTADGHHGWAVTEYLHTTPC